MTDLESVWEHPKFKDALEGFNGQLVELVRFRDVRDTSLRNKLNQQDYQELLKCIASSCLSIKSISEFDKSQLYLTCGDSALDNFLGGGLLTQGSITEITGESGSGKTQLAVQLCLAVQLPLELKGLDGGAVYLSSENAFPLSRLLQMAEGFKKRYSTMKDRDFSANIFIEKITLADCLQTLQWRLPALLETRKIRLIILDSIAGIFRGEMTQTTQRAKYLHAIGHRLKELSLQFGTAVLCINQVSSRMNPQNFPYQMVPVATEYGKYPNQNVAQFIPAMGLAWSNEVNVRIMLSRKTGNISRHLTEELDNEADELESNPDAKDNDQSKVHARAVKRSKQRHTDNVHRQIHVMFAPHLPPKSMSYVIDEDGVFGVDE